MISNAPTYQVVYSGGKKLQYIVKNSEDGMFYFLDETGIANGPFDSPKEARKELKTYIKEVLMGETD